MELNSHQDSSHRLAIGLSISLHLLLLLAGYYITISKPASLSTSYSITFTTIASPQQKKSNTTPKPVRRKQPQAQQKPKPSSATTPKKRAQKKESTAETEKKSTENLIPQEKEKNTLDERGLYKTQPGKQAGVKLDLAGWIWDTAPQPHDDTEETGKIVFEIKIDELGEVIAVKTLEKTVSPLVEKIYKDTLTELTFSRTADNIAYAPVYVGKVTFILRTN